MQSKVVRAAAFAAAFVMSATASYHLNAADLGGYPKYSPPPPAAYAPPPLPDVWSGWYLGGVVGYGWGDVGTNAGVGVSTDGWLGGAVLGWNHQAGRLVVGLEGDIVGSAVDGSTAFRGGTLRGDMDWMASLRARAGVAVVPDLLLFASIGAAWADFNLNNTGAGGGTASKTFTGIQYGGGAEVKLTPQWSARLDYQYTDFRSKTVAYGGGTSISVDPDVQQVRGALVYKF